MGIGIQQLQVKERNWSESIIREASWLSGIADSDERVEEILTRIGKVAMNDSTIWRHVQERGKQLCKAAAMALPQRGELPRQASIETGRMGVGLDGAMVHRRKEGRKEFKVGAVFSKMGHNFSW